MANKYKIIERKENEYQSVIEKSGIKVEFTISELNSNIQALKKQVVEIESKVGIEKATMQNIIQSHPEIVQLLMGQKTAKDLGLEEYVITEKDRLAIDMFERSRRFVNGAEDKLLEFAVAIKDDERSLKEACQATGIPMPVEVKTERVIDKKEQVDKIINSEIK